MTLRDPRDLTVSTQSPAALERFDDALTLFHGYYGDPLAAADAALVEDPGFVLAHCLRGGILAMSTEKAMVPLGKASLEAAAAGPANARERAHVAALRAWFDDDFEHAVRLWGDILIEHPRDTLALQLAHLGDFYLGQSVMLRDRVARTLYAWDEGVPSFGFVLGMYAFGLEEMGLYERAEETGRRALSLNARDPWAVHAVAHVCEMQNRVADGIAWLRARQPEWSRDNGFAFHNWWHLALYHLELGETDRVLALYDGQIRPRSSAVVLEMIDASALLWRLKLLGTDVGGRWNELADRWAELVDDGHYAFNDAHAMMALVGAGRDREARALLAAAERAVSGQGTNARMTREVGLPVCRALYAFGQGDMARTCDLLLPVMPRAHQYGGSHAQRDLLSLTAVEAALRSGRASLAHALISERQQRKPASQSVFRLRTRLEPASARELAFTA
jgi:hypothetical protein